MATKTALTTGAQTVTTAGAVAPTTGLDISTWPADYTLEIQVNELTAASGTPRARIIIEDTINAFTASVPVAELNLAGPIAPDAPVIESWRMYRAPSLRVGTANAKLRVNVVALDGTTPSLTLQASIR